MQPIKIYIERPEDRDAVIVVLSRNGYAVRQGKERLTSGKYVHFVEYWRQP